jgi:hypothetical protein
MFSAFFGGDQEPPIDEEKREVTRERVLTRVFREFVAERLQEEAVDFFDDDVARGRHVTDAAIQLADALASRQRELNNTCDHVSVADAIVQLVREHEGAALHSRRDRFDRFVESRVVASTNVDSPPPPMPVLVDNVSERVQCAWRATIDSMFGEYDTLVYMSRMHRQMPGELYDRWVRDRARIVGSQGGELRSLDVSYSLNRPDPDVDDNQVEVDHAEYARHTLRALEEAARTLAIEAAGGIAGYVRVELTLNVSLLRGRQRRVIVDDGSPATGVHCSLAYRCYALAPQRRIDFDDEGKDDDEEEEEEEDEDTPVVADERIDE